MTEKARVFPIDAISSSCYDLDADMRSCHIAGHVHSYERSNPVWAQALPVPEMVPSQRLSPAYKCRAAGL